MRVERLRPGDAARFEAMLDLFGEVFEDRHTYGAARPGAAYRDRLLASDAFVALVAVDERLEQGGVVGALTAYEFVKFEQERSLIYVHDLAVAEAHRRRGIATALIEATRAIAAAAGADTVFVQADADDAAAVALYERHAPGQPLLYYEIPAAAP